MKIYIITLLALFMSLPSINAQDKKEHSHIQHLEILISEYLAFKDALVADDYETAKVHISTFDTEVKSNKEMNDHKEHQKMHEAHHSKMLAAVNVATSAENIKELRNSLEAITLELVSAVEKQGYDKSALFVQFCPMANGGKGAKWISDNEEVRNPYYGAQMLKCGTVLGEIDNK